MAHYVIVGEGVHPAAAIERTRGRKQFGKRRWMDGNILGCEIPEPVVYDLDARYPGNPKALYHAEPVPVMSVELVEVLAEAGVNNLELFDAVLHDPVSGRDFSNYKAFNVVGKVAAADMEASTRMGVSNSTLISVDFDSLVLDEGKCFGLKLFRLAEQVGAIVVDESIKSAIERSGIPGIFFYASGEWSG